MASHLFGHVIMACVLRCKALLAACDTVELHHTRSQDSCRHQAASPCDASVLLARAAATVDVGMW